MKRFKQHWSARPLSWLLSVAMMWPALIFLMAAGPSAKAQILQRNSQPLWAVLDFENHSGYGGPEIGRTASDALVVELGKSNKYEVLSRAETQSGLANTGQTPPLDVIGVQKLGRALQTNAVATGEVAAVAFSKSPRQATVSVIVRVTDTNTGELVNGALAQGTSNPRAVSTSDDDALVNEAINNAAFAAVRQIIQFNLPKATVLNNEDQDRVLLNKGTRDGLSNGLNMVVTRNGNEVGRIRVADASQDQSDAVVTRRGLGIQPQDLATAVYQLPSYSINNNQLQAKAEDVNKDGSQQSGSRPSVFSGVTGVLLAVLAGVLLVSLVRRGGGKGAHAGGQIGHPAAVEGQPSTVGFTGVQPASDTETAIEDPTTHTGFTGVSVLVSADIGNGIPPLNFIEYHVYRSNFPAILQDAATLGTATGTAIITGFGQVPIFAQAGSAHLIFNDDGSNKISITASKPTPISSGGTTTTTTTTGGTNNGGNTLQTVGVSAAGGIPGTGIPNIGDRFYYLIEGLYSQQLTQVATTGNTNSSTTGSSTTGSTGGSTSGSSTTGNTTGTTLVTDYFLTARSQTNYVTYIEPVVFTGDGVTFANSSFSTSTSADNVIVNVPSTRSADDYVLDLSTDLSFSKKTRLTPNTTGPYNAAVNDPRNGNPVIWYLQNGSKSGSLRELYPTATQIFARIGSRDSRNGTNSSVNPYIFSDTVAVPSGLLPSGTGITPPPPPSAPAARRHH